MNGKYTYGYLAMAITFKRTVTKLEFFMLSLKNPRLLRYLIICTLSFLLAYLLNRKVITDSLKTLQSIGFVITIIIGIVTLVLALRILLTIVLWLTLKRFKGLFLPQEFTFNKNGMKLVNAFGGSVTKEWSGFAGWKKSKSGYLLKLFPSGVISIKRRDVPADKIAPFETLLEANIGRLGSSVK